MTQTTFSATMQIGFFSSVLALVKKPEARTMAPLPQIVRLHREEKDLSPSFVRKAFGRSNSPLLPSLGRINPVAESADVRKRIPLRTS